MVLGGVVAFVVAVNVVRLIRPALLLDSEPSWALPRLVLGLAVIAAAVVAGGAAAGLFVAWSRSGVARAPLQPLPLSPAWLAAIVLSAFVLGAFVRLVALDSIPEALWVDEVSEVRPALDLAGGLRDFADSIRTVPFGETPTGTVGVLYLEFFRFLILFFGTSVFSLRLPAALAGIVSLATTGLLARKVLPRGGGALAVVILAGLYWHLTMSRIGWVAIVIAPLIDVAALLLLRARARSSLASAAAAGAVIGAAVHVYLSACVAAVGLLAMAFWPLHSPPSAPTRRRFLVPALLLAGFVAAASPLFLFRAGRVSPYFLRTRSQSVLNEMQYRRSALPVFEAAADGISGPWLFSKSRGWPHNVRLGSILGVFLAIAFARSLRHPRDDFSALVLTQAAAALAATILAGHGGVPNGFRFGYLSDLTAVATAGGALWIVTPVRPAWRRAAAIALIGTLCAGAALGIHDMLFEQMGTPGGDPSGQETLIARSALRWERLGAVEIDRRLIHFKSMIDAVRRYRLDPGEADARGRVSIHEMRARKFRIVPSGAVLRPGERPVEFVRGRGQSGPVVLGALGSLPE